MSLNEKLYFIEHISQWRLMGNWELYICVAMYFATVIWLTVLTVQLFPFIPLAFLPGNWDDTWVEDKWGKWLDEIIVQWRNKK